MTGGTTGATGATGALCRRETATPFEQSLELIDLSDQKKNVIRNRYVPLLRNLKGRSARLALSFNTARAIITVGSLVVPALLSIQYTDGVLGSSTGEEAAQEYSRRIYWITWFISLLVTISNGLLTLFKLDKKYYYVSTTLEHLTSEGWQYIGLTGKYCGPFFTPGQRATYENQFIYFCHAVEKIRMRQIEEEYYKLSDTQQQQAQGSQAGPAGAQAPRLQLSSDQVNAIISKFVPPTPLRPEQLMNALPPELLPLFQEYQQKQQASAENAGRSGSGSENENKKEDGPANREA